MTAPTRKQLAEAIVQHVRENYDDGVFTVMDMYQVGESLGAPKHTVKAVVRDLCDDEIIIKHGVHISVRGGSKPTTYKLNPTPKAKKTSTDFQREAREKLAYMNECSLRLANALGIPMQGAA